MCEKPKEPKHINEDGWNRWAYKEGKYSWTVDITDNNEIVEQAHRINGTCPLCKEWVYAGSRCSNLDLEKVIQDYRRGRLLQIFDPEEVERD